MLTTAQTRIAHTNLIKILGDYVGQEALVRQFAGQATPRGGKFGTDASAKILQALTQIAIGGYTALADGVQVSDLAVLPKLYPNAVKIAQNWSEARQELGELDIEDIVNLARELCNIAESLAKGFAGENASRSAITPEEAWKAAKNSLFSVRDVVKVGLRVFANGFDILKIPELLSLFPQATSLAQNAPVAVQSWEKLDLQQKGDILKVAIDVVIDILLTLENQGK